MTCTRKHCTCTGNLPTPTLRHRLRRAGGEQWHLIASVIIVAAFCWAVGEWPLEWLGRIY